MEMNITSMELLDMNMNMTNGSNATVLTAIPGPRVVELIVLAALSFGIILCCAIHGPMMWFCWVVEEENESGHVKISVRFSNFTAAVFCIGGIVAVTGTVPLVAGIALSLQNGNSTETPALSAEGITGRVLLILTGVILLLVRVVWIIWCGATCHLSCGDSNLKCIYASAIAVECVLGTVFVIGITLLGWSSFEFDPIQRNGSNSTVTPGLYTAGVVISSVGLGLPFFVWVTMVCVACAIERFCRKSWNSCIEPWESCIESCKSYTEDHVTNAEEWLEKMRNRRQVTKEREARLQLSKSRLQLSKSLLDEALKHGYVECRTVVCLLVGVAGAGKTHTKHLLFSWAPPDIRNSTALAMRPVQAVRVLASERSGQLQEIDPDQLDQIIASTVATGVPLEKTKFIQNLCCIRKTEEKQSKGTGISPPSKSAQSHSIIENQPTSLRRWCCSSCIGRDSELQQMIKASLYETAHQIANTSGPQQFLDGDWIYLIDSGGQIEFLDVLPSFLQHTSVCLFVTKLSEMLSERPKIEYFEDGKLVGDPILCPFTNEEMFMRCVQTIQSQCIDEGGSTNQGSKLVMIGTHRDLEHMCTESRKEKNERLQSKLSPAFDQSLVFRDQRLKELIFPINAKAPCNQDHEVASEITEVIWNVTSSLEPRKTPISWFKFEQHLQKLARSCNQKILLREECLQVARLFHLSEEALDAALDHLAHFGVIHYYPHLLPNIVFVDPQFLLNKISELVKYHYKLRHEADPRKLRYKVDPKMLRKFRNEGCITLKLLNQFPEEYTNFFTPADFLKLLSNRLIVAHLISDDEYFMTCLLRTMESEELDQYRVTASGVVPLAIRFSCGLVPHGVFCSLVAFLRSSQNSSWRLSPSPENITEPLCLTRNCIKFQLPENAPGSLTLIDAFSHFEVYVNKAPHDIRSHLCPSIWHTLFEGIQNAAATLKYPQLVPKQAFLCKHKNTQPHLAIPSDTFDYWKCELNPETSGPLTNEHKVWKVGETPTTAVGSTTDTSSPTAVLPTHSPAQQRTSLPTACQSPQLQQKPQVATPSQIQQYLEAQTPKEVRYIPMAVFSKMNEGLQATTDEMKCVLEVHSEVDEDCPTVLECTRLQGRERRINIPQEIGSNYYLFGLHLLDDPNGTRIHNLEHDYREIERINTKILQEWATGRGRKPVTWKTLTEVLCDIGLFSLASDIEEVKLNN